jgi:uncharacterized protein (UPF0335 family)
MVHTTILDPTQMPSRVDNQKNPDLIAHVERIESLEEEKADIAGQIKDEYTVAASKGFDKKMIRKTIALRRKLREKGEDAIRRENDTFKSYLAGVGMAVQLDLGV